MLMCVCACCYLSMQVGKRWMNLFLFLSGDVCECLCLPVNMPSLTLCSFNAYQQNECEYGYTLTRCALGPLAENQQANSMHTVGITCLNDMEYDLKTDMYTEGSQMSTPTEYSCEKTAQYICTVC